MAFALLYAFQPASVFLSYQVDLDKQQLDFFWKDAEGERYGNFGNLKTGLEHRGKKLLFATNGGMYQKDRKPLGLYIENYKTLQKLNTRSSEYGNFYLKPNGVFYIQEGNARICKTEDFEVVPSIQYATQSGPMLLIDGNIHPEFNAQSKHRHIRNGVGILENGQLLFVMSKEKVTFYELANYFKNQGCKNALYLDGFVSRTYLPEKNWIQTEGDFGVIIGVTGSL